MNILEWSQSWSHAGSTPWKVILFIWTLKFTFSFIIERVIYGKWTDSE